MTTVFTVEMCKDNCYFAVEMYKDSCYFYCWNVQRQLLFLLLKCAAVSAILNSRNSCCVCCFVHKTTETIHASADLCILATETVANITNK